MSKRIKVTDAGVEEVEVPAGVSSLPPAIQERINGGVGGEGGEGATDATDELLSELLGDPQMESVQPVEVMVGEQVLKFGIKRLSQREISVVLRKRMRTISGKISPAADADIILKTLAIAECTRKNIALPGVETPLWAPMWTLEQVTGTPDKKGLIDNGSENAQSLIDQLLAEINRVNMNQLNPLFLGAMETVLSEGAKSLLNA